MKAGRISGRDDKTDSSSVRDEKRDSSNDRRETDKETGDCTSEMWFGSSHSRFHLKRHFQQMLKNKNNRETKPLMASDLKNIRNYLEKIQIKPKNGRVWIVKKGNKGLFVEPKC